MAHMTYHGFWSSRSASLHLCQPRARQALTRPAAGCLFLRAKSVPAASLQLETRRVVSCSTDRHRPSLLSIRKPAFGSSRIGLAIPSAAATSTSLIHHSPSYAHSIASSVAPSSVSNDQLPPYAPPTRGLLSLLPPSWVPYAELTRIDKPTGTYYLVFPCIFSTLMAAPMVVPAMASPSSVAGTGFLFFAGALLMRSAGCSINDLWDRNLDPHVARTRHRPLARRAITPFNALAFTGAQLLGALAVLLQFPPSCFFYAVPSLALVAVYPLMKRVTYYPQFVLGLTFSWGALMGFPALGVDLLTSTTPTGVSALWPAGLLYASNIAWTVLYDMIYAHMDIKDDVKAGIKSIALKHDAQTKSVLTGLAVVQIGLLAAAGLTTGAGPAFFIGSCGGAAATLGTMIWRVNLKSVKDCWWWFVNGCWFTGGAISLGLAMDYMMRYYGQKSTPSGPGQQQGQQPHGEQE